MYINESSQNIVIFKSFSVSVSFSVLIENHPNEEKTYTLFVNMSPVIDPNEHSNTI